MKWIYCLAALCLVACGDDGPAAPSRGPHAVDAPFVDGPSWVRAGRDACWSVDVTDQKCNHGHALGVSLAVNDQPTGNYYDTGEECWPKLEQTVDVYARAKCADGLTSELVKIHVKIGP